MVFNQLPKLDSWRVYYVKGFIPTHLFEKISRVFPYPWKSNSKSMGYKGMQNVGTIIDLNC